MTALLFVDCESTGLTDQATVLEFAWTITSMDGDQRGPLRSRFCAIVAPGWNPLVPERRSPDDAAEWSRPPQPGQETDAVAMAVRSGLFDDWLACPAALRVQSGAALEQLVLDDVFAYTSPGETVHLAGNGVAQFDQPMLRRVCPRLVVPRGVFGGPVHYRPVDQSGNFTGMLGVFDARARAAVTSWYLNGQDDKRAYVWAPEHTPEAIREWLLDGRAEHRAGPDVARALVFQRAVWNYAEPLRKVINGASG